ncbi:MAG: type VII toxin-antitoxin system MntA family adenylyltransferase antitoxin [Candidatus Anammoxibacter sp.]
MNKITEEVIKDKLSPLFKNKSLRLVILFGSVASGNSNKKSDVDLGFLFDKRVDILELTNTVIMLLKNDNADVVDLKHASPLLRFAAVKKCKLLYEKEPGMFNEFVSLAFRMYVDTKKLRDARAKSIKIFLEKGC